MTTPPFGSVRHRGDGELTPSQLRLLQLAQMRDLAAPIDTPMYNDALTLCACGYLRPRDCSAATPPAASYSEQFTVMADGMAWLREHGHDDDGLCRCRVCAGRG
jgi:hypothetical protein